MVLNNSKKFIGALGENVAAKYLIKNGYAVMDRNFRRPWGEIDIIAQKSGIIHFIEV
ncbi:MAG: YraN family protein, partial [Patescibacteria group bacterium]